MRQRGGRELKAIVSEPALEHLGFNRVGIIGHHGQVGRARKGGATQIRPGGCGGGRGSDVIVVLRSRIGRGVVWLSRRWTGRSLK